MTQTDRLYSPHFFRVFVATMLTMTGVSMQYHFGEYVTYLGYGVEQLGLITGVGAVGSIFLRPYAGAWIDRVGCRPCFLVASSAAAIANVSFQFADTFWTICFLRVLMVASTATFLTTVAVYAAHAAPPQRRAESLGTIGIGGFLGMMIGPAIGDAIFAGGTTSADEFRFFFTVASCLSLAAGVVVIDLRAPTVDEHREPAPFLSLLREHWPGMILGISVVFCSILTLHMVFLERYADYRGFESIRWFFFVYAPTAIALRLFCRRVPERVGRERVCAGGLFVMAGGVLLMIPVRAEWHLIFPALLMGAGHSFVFPSMVDLAAEALPWRHRGIGTSVTLGAGDLGFLLGGIGWGRLIHWQGFETTFVVAAFITAMAAMAYLLMGKHRTAGRSQPQELTPTE